MSDLKGRKYLKSRFEDGDCPNGNDFAELIDSCINQKSDRIFAVDHQLGIGTDAPSAPLNVNGSSGDQKISAILTDGCNSTLRFGHPSKNDITIGGNKKDDIQIGVFDDCASTFTPIMSITSSGRVGIGVSQPQAELHVADSVKAGQSVAIGEAVLTFHRKKLWLEANGKRYYIVMEEADHRPHKHPGLLIVLLILCAVNLLAIIVFIILYLLHWI